jgi:acetyl-CoA C-acetyltransferase
MNDPVILSAVRTPIGRFQGGLRTISAPALGSVAIRAAVDRAAVSAAEIDEVIMGAVLTAGLGQNPARQAAIGASLSVEIPAFTVNKVCGSGLKAVALAAQAVKTGDVGIAAAGGMESMSRAPYLLPKARDGYRLGHGALVDSMIHDGLWDVYEDIHMGMTAEFVAETYGISRERQDAYALESHRRAVAAMKDGAFQAEIVPVPLQGRGSALRIDADESPRPDATADALAALKAAFKPDGTVTAGNASALSDGAAAVIVASSEHAARLGLTPMARIAGYATSGVEPRQVMMAPVPAIEKLLAKVGWRLGDVDLFELNEAFAVQALALIGRLEIDPARVNVNGGAVALGHPIGASGARILVTLLHAMARRRVRRGIAALCLGGGNAVAMAVER